MKKMKGHPPFFGDALFLIDRKRMNNVLRKLLVFFLFATVAAYSAHDIANLDIWYHLRSGRFILENFKIPQLNIFSYIAADHPSHDPYWLFQIIIYLTHRIAGANGLVVFKIAVLLAMFFFLFKITSRLKPSPSKGGRVGVKEGGDIAPVFCLLLAALAASERFVVRPELASYIFLSLYFYLLHQYCQREDRKIYLLFPLQILWVNMHGFWVLGLFLVWAFLAGELILWRLPLPFQWKKEGAVQGNAYYRVLVIGLLVTAATLITPHPQKILQLPFEMFGGLKGATGRGGPLAVNELISPFSANLLFSWQAIFYYKVLLVVSASAFVLNFRRINIIHLLIWAGFLYISIQARRNIAAFALVSAPITFWNLSFFYRNYIERFSAERAQLVTSAQVILSAVLILLMAFLIYDVASDRYYIRDRSNARFGLGISTISYPEKAIDFIQKTNIQGNIFNEPAIGHYFTWRCFPERIVFLDGRFDFPDRFLSHYYVPELWPKISKKYDINYVLLGHGRSPNLAGLIRMLYFNKDWVLIHYDEMAVVFIKNLPENRQIIEKFRVRFDAMEDKTAAGISRKNLFGHTGLPVAKFQLANLYTTLGLRNMAVKTYEECIQLFPAFWEARSNLADMYRRGGRLEDALAQYRMAVETKPNFVAGYVRLGDAYAAMRMFPQAIQSYKKALKRDFKLAAAHRGLALSYIKTKNYEHAERELEEMLELDPADPMTRRMLAYCRRMTSEGKLDQ